MEYKNLIHRGRKGHSQKLKKFNKNNHVLKKGRTKEQDLDILEPDGFEYKEPN